MLHLLVVIGQVHDRRERDRHAEATRAGARRPELNAHLNGIGKTLLELIEGLVAGRAILRPVAIGPIIGVLVVRVVVVKLLLDRDGAVIPRGRGHRCGGV